MMVAAVLLAGCSGGGMTMAVDAAQDRDVGGDASAADAAPDGPTDAGTDAPMPVDAGRDTGTDAGPVDSGNDAGAVYECDVVEQDCAEGEACRFRLGERGTVCMEDTGNKRQGDDCSALGECEVGLQCIDHFCREPCRGDGDCGSLWDGPELECMPAGDLESPNAEASESLPIYPREGVGICDR